MNTETAVVKITDRDQFLATQPKLRSEQDLHYEKSNRVYVEFQSHEAAMRVAFVGMVQCGQTVGEEIDAVAQTLPGRQFTLDFHDQAWNGQGVQLRVPFDKCELFLTVAKHLDGAKVKTFKQAVEFQKEFLSLAGIERKKPEPHLLPQLAPWALLKAELEKSKLPELIAALASDPDRCPPGGDGLFRADLRRMYSVEWKAIIDAQKELHRMLGAA
jgi:hypothetical protein